MLCMILYNCIGLVACAQVREQMKQKVHDDNDWIHSLHPDTNTQDIG